MRIFTGENEKYDGRPLYEAVVTCAAISADLNQGLLRQLRLPARA
jgi:PII-like signaling protein